MQSEGLILDKEVVQEKRKASSSNARKVMEEKEITPWNIKLPHRK